MMSSIVLPYFSATQPGTKNVLFIWYSSSMARSMGTPTLDSKRPMDIAMGSLEPRKIQATSASRSNVNRQTERIPRGHAFTTGSGNAAEAPFSSGYETFRVGFVLLRLAIGQ